MGTYEDVYPNDNSFDDIYGDFYVSLAGAVELGDMDTLRVIKANEPVSFLYFLRNMGGRLLFRAIFHSQFEVADFLLCNGCATDQLPCMGTSPLHFAAQSSQCSAFFDRLLQYETDVNKKDFSDNTPLHLACRANLVGVCKALLTNGADCNMKNKDSDTPLHIAASLGHLSCLRLLLEVGVQRHVVSKGIDSHTPLDRATQSLFTLLGHETITQCAHAFLKWSTSSADKILVKLKNANLSEMVQQVLCLPTTADKLQAIDLIIQNGAKFDILIQISKLFPANIALRTIQLLIENHLLDINIHDDLHFTPLHYAARRLPLEAVKYFIDQGANVNSLSVNMVSPLELALRKPVNKDVVRLLVESGANVNFMTPNGWSPLTAALQTGHVALAQLLLDWGANPNLEDPSGYTALMHQLQQTPCHAALIDCLIQSGASVQARDGSALKSTPLHRAAYFERNEGTEGALVMEMLLSQVTNVDVQDAEGYTPLMRAVAVKYHSLPIIKLLLKAGASSHLRGLDDNSPMHLAILNSKIEIIPLLLDQDRNVDFATLFSNRSILTSTICMNLPYNRDKMFFVRRFHYRRDVIKARKGIVNEVLETIEELTGNASFSEAAFSALLEWLKSSPVERSCLSYRCGGPAVLLQEAENYVLKRSLCERTAESHMRGVLEYRLKVNSNGESYVGACALECASMRHHVICCGLSVYDVLLASVDKLMKLMQKREVYQALILDSEGVLINGVSYPIYSHLLRKHVEAASARFDLVQSATYFLNVIFSRRIHINNVEPAKNTHQSFTTLPPHVMDNIMGHLSTEDLLSFCISHLEQTIITTLKQRWRAKLTMLLNTVKLKSS